MEHRAFTSGIWQMSALSLALFLSVALPAQTPKKLPSGGTAFRERGIVRGSADTLYSVDLTAGQAFCLNLTASNTSAYMNIYPPGVTPGAGEAIFTGSISGQHAELQAKQSGNYLVQVFLMRSAARRGAATSFSLTGPSCKTVSH